MGLLRRLMTDRAVARVALPEELVGGRETSLEQRPGNGGTDDRFAPFCPQRAGRRVEACTRRGDVVDDQYTRRARPRRQQRRSQQALRSGPARLWAGVEPIEERPDRPPAAAGDLAGEQGGVVESAPPLPYHRRGHPGDLIHAERRREDRIQRRRQHRHEHPPVPVLEADHRLPDGRGVNERGEPLVEAGRWRPDRSRFGLRKARTAQTGRLGGAGQAPRREHPLEQTHPASVPGGCDDSVPGEG